VAHSTLFSLSGVVALLLFLQLLSLAAKLTQSSGYVEFY